jgi:hypothetical protein
MFVALAATFAFAQTTGTNIGGGAPWINKTIASDGSETYTFSDLPDSGTIHRQSFERTVPASNGNLKIGDVDFLWGYEWGCGPSPSGLLDDCTQGYYFNRTSISAGVATNKFLPAYRSQAIENSWNTEAATNGDLWYEQNEDIIYPIIDVTVAGSSGTWTVDNYIIINTWGGGSESWAKILFSVEDVTVSSRTGTFDADNYFLVETRLCTGGSEPGTACVVDGDCAGGGACDDITEIANGKIDAASANDLDLAYYSNGNVIDTDDTVVEVDNLTDKTPLDAYASWSSASHNSIRLSFQGTLVTPAVDDVVTEVDNPVDRNADDASGTWPSSETAASIAFRTKQQEFSMTGTPTSWTWIVPTDMTASDLTPQTVMKVQHNAAAPASGVAVNSSLALGASGLQVGGKVFAHGESNAPAPCDTHGCVTVQNSGSGVNTLIGHFTNDAASNRLPLTQGSGATTAASLAPLPRYSTAGIGYMYTVGAVGSWTTGTAICGLAVFSSECSKVICMGSQTGSHNADCVGSTDPYACCTGAGTGTCNEMFHESCATDMTTDHNSHTVLLSCYEDD